MARKRNQRDTPPSQDKPGGWSKLTWDDLTAWAGPSVDKGRRYQDQDRVSDLAISADGKLLAWVQGTKRYATTVELLPGDISGNQLRSRCTCPLEISGCKHAVAVVLDYLEALRNKTPVPTASNSDPRWSRLDQPAASPLRTCEEDEEDDYEEEDEDYEDEWDEEEEDRPRRSRSWADPEVSETSRDESLRDFLQSKTQAELVDMILDLAENDPDFKEELKEQNALHFGKTDELIEQAREAIEEVTAEPVGRDYWDDDVDLPDYSGVKRRLENLLERGQADAVVELGRELIDRGLDQVEQSHDEGETAGELSDCLVVVFQAVARSSLPNPQKLLYAIDACLDDDYDVCQGVEEVLNKKWPASDWSVVADELAGRLRSLKKPSRRDDFSIRYERDGLVNWLINALEEAGRQSEIVPLCEAEAPLTGSYERLVARLLKEGRLDDASRWALEGIERTEAQWPGIARQLRDHLREIAEKRQDWPLVAAYRAEDFFNQPSVGTLEELLQAAAQAGCESQVRAVALRFLETGQNPLRPEPEPAPAPARSRSRKKGKAARATQPEPAPSRTPPPPAAPADWPLPLPPAGSSRDRAPRIAGRPTPHYDVLLQLAIQENRPDDVLRWYDRMQEANKASLWGAWGDHYAVQVADAVAATHPDRALAIYRKLAESLIEATNPSAYESAANHLRKVRNLLQQHGRAAEWTTLLAGIRQRHRRKRRLLEILDRLDSPPIIEG